MTNQEIVQMHAFDKLIDNGQCSDLMCDNGFPVGTISSLTIAQIVGSSSVRLSSTFSFIGGHLNPPCLMGPLLER